LKTRAIFFDRDGVVNKRIVGGYIRNWDEFHFLPEIGDTLKELKKRGYLAIIITNQRGVGKGIMTEKDLENIHARMQSELLEKFGVQFDAIISCTDANNESGRRKPSPAMLLEAQRTYNIDMQQSWMIGDTASDIEAGERAGTKTVFLLNDHDVSPANAVIQISSPKEILQFL
jgi:D-glycero-D-manno-heptose 1,7-bisphosphate phosphatase